MEDPIRLNALAGTSTDLWAFGSIGEYLCCTGAYWLHWDGSSWTQSAAVAGGPGWDASRDDTDLWVVGGWDAWVAHFDGTSWSLSLPHQRLTPDLRAITAVAGRAWVVGNLEKPGAPN